uniref:C2H2-type domain-containing protein n=1 Tax=Salarias fasciatus TaxID=181472 RepID=A0A672HPG0_SALFA
MCICHLPCRPLKTGSGSGSGSGPDQAGGRHGAHYHCVVCSGTIGRRTDMVGHLRRHGNRGETEGSYPGNAEPSNVDIQVLPNFGSPQRSDTYFNSKMKINRQLVLCCVSVLSLERPLDCLDAFGATGLEPGPRSCAAPCASPSMTSATCA